MDCIKHLLEKSRPNIFVHEISKILSMISSEGFGDYINEAITDMELYRLVCEKFKIFKSDSRIRAYDYIHSCLMHSSDYIQFFVQYNLIDHVIVQFERFAKEKTKEGVNEENKDIHRLLIDITKLLLEDASGMANEQRRSLSCTSLKNMI